MIKQEITARDRQGLKCDDAKCDPNLCNECLFDKINISEFEEWEKKNDC